MLVSCIRTVFLYVVLIITIRIMGKKQVGELEPSELVVVFLLSELASIPMQDMNLPLMSSIIPIATLISLEILVSVITLKSRFARKLLQGTPAIIIEKGKLVESEMKRHCYNIDELLEQIRNEGYSDLRDVEFAIIENNGKISVIPSAKGKAVTAADLGIECSPGTMPYIVVADGRIASRGIEIAGTTEKEVLKKLKSNGVKNIKEVLFAIVDSSGDFYFQVKENST